VGEGKKKREPRLTGRKRRSGAPIPSRRQTVGVGHVGASAGSAIPCSVTRHPARSHDHPVTLLREAARWRGILIRTRALIEHDVQTSIYSPRGLLKAGRLVLMSPSSTFIDSTSTSVTFPRCFGSGHGFVSPCRNLHRFGSAPATSLDVVVRQ